MIDKSTCGVRGSCSGIYKARHLIPSISIRTTGYGTEQLPVVKSVVVLLSQIEEWCFPYYFTHDLLLRHSEARRLVPVQLKHFFLREYQPAFFDITSCFAVAGCMPQISRNKYNHGSYNLYHLFDMHFHV